MLMTAITINVVIHVMRWLDIVNKRVQKLCRALREFGLCLEELKGRAERGLDPFFQVTYAFSDESLTAKCQITSPKRILFTKSARL
jgi:hypothetical protein